MPNAPYEDRKKRARERCGHSWHKGNDKVKHTAGATAMLDGKCRKCGFVEAKKTKPVEKEHEALT